MKIPFLIYKNKQCLLLLAIALLSVQQASAIGISVDEILLHTSIDGVLVTIQEHSTPLPLTIQTRVQGPKSLGLTDWSVTNTATQAVFSDSFYLSNNRDPFFGGSETFNELHNVLRFTLTESVNYSLTGSMGGTVHGNGLASFEWGIGTNNEWLQLDGVRTEVSGTFSPASITGTLNPGSYYLLTQTNALFGSEASGGLNFILTSLSQNGNGNNGNGNNGNGNNGNGNNGNGNHVPDAGSTLTLLGIALGALRFCRR